MLTRCPRPDCKHQFDFLGGAAGPIGTCPVCGQVASFKPLELTSEIERAYARRLDSGQIKGGPCISSQQPAQFSALMEDVRSLWNVGSIFRTSDGAGVSQLYLCGITGCPPRKEIAKTSLGADETVSWQYYGNSLEIIPALKNSGVQVVGLECTADSIPLADALERSLIQSPLCLVAGNEVSGLSAETLSLCDLVCQLPMRGKKESLNVAVAFGIAAYMVTGSLAHPSGQPAANIYHLLPTDRR